MLDWSPQLRVNAFAKEPNSVLAPSSDVLLNAFGCIRLVPASCSELAPKHLLKKLTRHSACEGALDLSQQTTPWIAG